MRFCFISYFMGVYIFPNFLKNPLFCSLFTGQVCWKSLNTKWSFVRGFLQKYVALWSKELFFNSNPKFICKIILRSGTQILPPCIQAYRVWHFTVQHRYSCVKFIQVIFLRSKNNKKVFCGQLLIHVMTTINKNLEPCQYTLFIFELCHGLTLCPPWNH